MESELLNNLVTYISWFSPIIVSIAVLVFGILINTCKIRPTGMLGISFIFGALRQFITGFYTIAVHFLKESEVHSIAYPYNILLIITAGLSTLFLCFFIHKNYGKKLIYIPMFAIPAAGWFLGRLALMLITSVNSSGIKNIMMLETAFEVSSFITSAATTLILIIIFAKKRKTEKIIPKAWLIEVILLCWSGVKTAILIFIYLHMASEGTTVGGMDYNLLLTVNSSTEILFPLYVFLKVFGAAKKKEQEDSPYEMM